MKRTNLILSLTATLSTAACYGAAPPRPARVAVPELSDEAVLEVHTESNTAIENVQKESWSCPAGHAEGSQACTRTTYEVAEPVTHTETTATYGAQPISYAQFKVMTDPDYDRKLARLDTMRSKCRGANLPRYLGMGLMLGGVAAIVASGNTKPIGLIGWGGLAGGGVSYAFGYYGYGGRTCNEARALYDSLDMREEAQWTSVYGADYASEMKAVADQFNAGGRRKLASESLSFDR